MKKFVEASFKVDVSGLPPIFMDAKSSVEIRKKLRRQLKFPDDIENIERITKGEKIKSFKDRLKSTLDGKGSDVKESAAYHAGLSKSTKSKRKAQFDKQAKMSDDNPAAYKPAPGDATAKTKPSVHTKKFKAMYGEDYSIGLDGKKLKASKALIRRYEEELLIDPKAMAKKTRFLSPQNKDKLKTDIARLKKALGPNHPMNKPKAEACWSGYKQVGMKKKGNRQVPNCVPEANVHELVQFAPAAMAVGAAAVRAAPAAGAALHSVQKTAKKVYKKFTGKEETDLEEKKKKLTKAQRNKKMRAADRARDKRIRKGNPFNVQV